MINNNRCRMTWSDYRGISEGGTYQPPHKKGVYVIFLDNEKENTYRMRYVGKGWIDERMVSHTSEDEENECLKKVIEENNVKFCFKLIDDDDERSDWEYSLWDYYKNEKKQRLCNDITPNGNKIEITLPI